MRPHLLPILLRSYYTYNTHTIIDFNRSIIDSFVQFKHTFLFLRIWSTNIIKPCIDFWSEFFIALWYYVATCRELSIVKIQTKTVVFCSTANTPMIHVIPRSGSSTMALLAEVLHRKGHPQ